MKVFGSLISMRGSVTAIDYATGNFSVKFDVPIGPENDQHSSLDFIVDVNNQVYDTTWHYNWEFKQ